jgi:SEC-C motif
VTEGEPYRPELIIWMDLPDGTVVGHHLQDPKAPIAFGATLATAMQRPLVGPPRRPARVRVATRELAESVRQVLGDDVEIVVAPTPELDAVLEAMKHAPRDDRPDESYLEEGRVSVDTVADLFGAAELVYRMAPWKAMDDQQLVRVDIPSLGIDGACLSVIGAGGESFGLILFPSLEGFEAFVLAGQMADRGPIDMGTTLLALSFERGADLPASMRREVSEHGWSVAGARGYPVVVHRDRDGVPRPLSERDFKVISACATSFGVFFLKNKSAFQVDDGDPISESYSDQDDLTVRLTYPYEGFHLFEGDTDEAIDAEPPPAPRRTVPEVPRNAPCPCGSGRKYKKCHLATDEAKGRDVQERPAVHEMDERVVDDMQRFAARRFRGIWQASFDAFEDVEREIQLASPWSVYCTEVDGRTVVDWYLSEKGRYLSPDQRGWLEAQQRSWLSIWEITDVDPGRGLRVHDLLTGEDRRVDEVKGSRVLVKRDAVLGRVVDHDGTSVFCGLYPVRLPPLDAAEIVRVVREKLRRKTAPPPERLRDEAIGRFMIRQWREAVSTMSLRANVPPKLTNLDGEKLRFTTDVFTFSSARRADVERGVKKIDGVEEPDGDDPRYVFLRGGRPARAGDGRTVLGTATLGGSKLAVETNSVERADALRSRVENACPGLLVHQRRDHADPLAPRLVRPSAEPSEVEDPPAAREAAQAFKRRHYQEWADQSVPALQGKTPREAIRTAQGREAVDALLKHFEHHEQRSPPDVRFDFNDMRRDLGLPA